MTHPLWELNSFYTSASSCTIASAFYANREIFLDDPDAQAHVFNDINLFDEGSGFQIIPISLQTYIEHQSCQRIIRVTSLLGSAYFCSSDTNLISSGPLEYSGWNFVANNNKIFTSSWTDSATGSDFTVHFIRNEHRWS